MKQVQNIAPGLQTVVALQDGALVTGTVQDCTAIADWTKAQHNSGFHGSKDMRLAARVPFVFVDKYLNDNGITLQELSRSADHKKRLLNDPALAHFRVWRGAL